eukprot:TRINITY_DN32861_c0_g1_i1.p1 TRINITY_DN32861_c0_g1~~TRINITY_DN32861_c0_g1_i1.p1  ORF type:complete len:140 (+),score=26.04 TRINITY_DN32861_c0_g1_i1:2-421(+)
MIRRRRRSTQGVSSAASDVYKRQVSTQSTWALSEVGRIPTGPSFSSVNLALSNRIRELEAESSCLSFQPTDLISYFNAYMDKRKKLHEALYFRDMLEKENFSFASFKKNNAFSQIHNTCLLYTSPSPRDLSTSRMPSSA